MEILYVPVQKISKDETFRFAKPDPVKIDRLEASIRISGLLEPVWVCKFSEGMRILAGFSRFEGAMAAGLSMIPVRTLIPEESLADIFYQTLLIHRISSEFNLIEKARILKITKGFGLVDAERRGRYLTLLELPAKQSVLDEVENLLSLEPEIQSYVEAYGLVLKQASRFLKFNSEEQRFCAELGRVLFIRPVELLELGTSLLEISRRDRLSVRNLTRDLGIQEILKADTTRGQKISEIKQRILERRYPSLTQWNRSIEAAARSIGLPDTVRLRWDKTLEAPGVQMQGILRSLQEVKDFVNILSSHKAEKELNTLFKVLS